MVTGALSVADGPVSVLVVGVDAGFQFVGDDLSEQWSDLVERCDGVCGVAWQDDTDALDQETVRVGRRELREGHERRGTDQSAVQAAQHGWYLVAHVDAGRSEI